MTGTETAAGAEQLGLVRRPTPRSRPSSRASSSKPSAPAAADLPVARVVVDVPLAHLDRPFDYLVPADLAERAKPGVRVRVRFAGRLVGGYLLDRVADSAHDGRLGTLHKVVSAEPVLSGPLHDLASAVAEHYVGTVPDVLRLALPPRHARVEAEHGESGEHAAPPPPPERPVPQTWGHYPRGSSLLDEVHRGAPVRAVWTALPGPTWPDEVARLMATALAGGRGALAVVPDHRDLTRVDTALAALVGPGQHVVLRADLGPAERYRRWLAARRGTVRAVVGTRAAMFAPIHDLGLALVWDDGDDLHAEPRAPYPHVRTVVGLRARLEGAALVVGGLTRTAEGAAAVRSGWAQSVSAPRDVVRRVAPPVMAVDEAVDPARFPTSAWQTGSRALGDGPVLVQVPRAGYLPGLACQACRESARCVMCGGPLAGTAEDAAPGCRWCGALATAWSCPTCASTRLRATVVGAGRTVEELARAFPRVPVRASGGPAPVLDRVGPEPALVVATPGAEPVADGGYAAALLLDGWALLTRPDLRAGEEALRRWCAAAALVRPPDAGGRVVVLAAPGHPSVQALVRWDPVTAADRELDDRAALGLPPVTRMVSLTGVPDALADFLAATPLPDDVAVLGPVTASVDQRRYLLRIPKALSPAVTAALRETATARSARKKPGSVRLQVDPLEIE